MPRLEPRTLVVLLEGLPENGLCAGDVGEVTPKQDEPGIVRVEFDTADHEIYDVVAVNPDLLRVARDDDVLGARSASPGSNAPHPTETYSAVLEDDLADHGLARGALGHVLGIRSGGLEVEFFSVLSRSLCRLIVPEDKLRGITEHDVFCAIPAIGSQVESKR